MHLGNYSNLLSYAFFSSPLYRATIMPFSVPWGLCNPALTSNLPESTQLQNTPHDIHVQFLSGCVGLLNDN